MERKIAEVGDVVACKGIRAEIAKIFYQECYEGWDIEFIDTKGVYRHWKQYFDGGELIKQG